MSRQPGFEKLYAKMHDIDPEDLVQYRFGSKDGYRLPQIASHYRLYCETLDSVESGPIAWVTDGYLSDKSATTYSPSVAERWKSKGWPVIAVRLCKVECFGLEVTP